MKHRKQVSRIVRRIVDITSVKNEIKKKIRKHTQSKFLVTGITVLALLMLAGCGEQDTEFLTEVPSAEEGSSVSQESSNIETGNKEISKKQTDSEKMSTGESSTEPQNTPAEETSPEAAKCYVHICGAVKQPGVYSVSADARIYEVVAMAGGFREDACTEYINQAAGITDGSQIRVPTIEEAEAYEPTTGERGIMTGVSVKDAPATANASEPETEGALVNLNTATQTQLCTLPGIGSAKAASIIAYREQTGGFRDTEELLNVDGIKSGTFQKLKDKICI